MRWEQNFLNAVMSCLGDQSVPCPQPGECQLQRQGPMHHPSAHMYLESTRGRRRTGGLSPWVFQPWKAPNQADLFNSKDMGLLDGLGGVELVSGLQKRF